MMDGQDMTIPAWAGQDLRPMDKLEVHRRGLRHPAVSVFVKAGPDFLWQRRAAGKYHSALQWANSCCTHPRWGEDPAACAARRLAEELGLGPVPVTPLGQVEYRADVGGGMVEHEVVAVFLADLDRRPALAPDPAEVAEVRWAPLAEIDAAIARDPGAYTPWLRLYLSDHRAELFGGNAAAPKSRDG